MEAYKLAKRKHMKDVLDRWRVRRNNLAGRSDDNATVLTMIQDEVFPAVGKVDADTAGDEYKLRLVQAMKRRTR